MCESSGRDGGGGPGGVRGPRQAEDREGRRADLPAPRCVCTHTQGTSSSRWWQSLRDPQTTPRAATGSTVTRAGFCNNNIWGGPFLVAGPLAASLGSTLYMPWPPPPDVTTKMSTDIGRCALGGHHPIESQFPRARHWCPPCRLSQWELELAFCMQASAVRVWLGLSPSWGVSPAPFDFS